MIPKVDIAQLKASVWPYFGLSTAGNDKGDGGAGEVDSAKVIGAAGAEIRANIVCSWSPDVLPTDDISCYPKFAQIFAYGAESPSEDAEVLGEEASDSDDYVGQSMLEVAVYLSISAGRRVSVAMTVNKLREEIQLDESYNISAKLLMDQ